MLLRDPLEARGYEIAEAENGEQALEQAAERPPEVILLDVMLPRMDGFEVCRRLRRDPRTAPIPVLMITALSERRERMAGIAAGANDFLNKPVDLDDLTLRVRNAVYTSQLFNQLQAERQRSEGLLLNLLPNAIAQRMKAGEVNIADYHSDATVLVAELVDFSALSVHIGAPQMVCWLNEIFSAFDSLVQQHGLETIKTLGDAYLAAGGISLPRPDHAEAMAELAFDLRAEIGRLNREYSTSLRLRLGISTGPLVAGVIGREKLAYDLWGDTVNLARHFAAVGEVGSITVSQATYERLQHRYRSQRRQTTHLRGRDAVTAYELEARQAYETNPTGG